MYPMKADIYYPIIKQTQYGQATKDWVFDRTIICNATQLAEQELKTLSQKHFFNMKINLLLELNLIQEHLLLILKMHN
jgi:hypothetical protein